MPAPTDHVVSLPVSPSEEVLEVFESKLRASVIQIMAESGLKWTTIGLWHRGRNPDRIDLCPPTILIRTSDPDPSKHNAWPAAEAKVRAEISKHAKTAIEVEVIHGKPVSFKGRNVGIPYPNPIPIGYSFGVAEEKIGIDPQTNKDAAGMSGTLGGYLLLPDHGGMKVAMTCNHVGNPWDLIADKSAEQAVVRHEMRSPSNQDNEATGLALVAPLILASTETFNRGQKEVLLKLVHSMEQEDLPENFKDGDAVFPAKSNRKISTAWSKFLSAIFPKTNKDFVTAMSWMPTAVELQSDDIKKCTFKDTLLELRNLYDSIWKAEMDNDSSADYRKTLTINRVSGTTQYASGRRVAPNNNASAPSDICVVDWALVQTNDLSNGTNNIPSKLADFANSAMPGCPLGKGKPITSFGVMKGNEIVFKIGATTGVTVGRVHTSKETLGPEALMDLGAIGADGKLGGKTIDSTNEWAVGGVIMKDSQVMTNTEAPPFAAGGDSGSWVVNANSELVGMVFAGFNAYQSTEEKLCFVADMAVVAKSITDVTTFHLAFP